MKVRNGFVSNSSSSSFIVVGCSYDLETPSDLHKVLLIVGYPEDYAADLVKQALTHYEEEGYLDYYKLKLDSILKKNPKSFDVVSSNEWSHCYIGKSLTNMSAIIDFTDETKHELANALGKHYSSVDLHYGEVEY